MSKMRKALTAAFVAAIGAATPTLADGALSGPDAGVILGAALAALIAVYLVPNKTSESRPRP